MDDTAQDWFDGEVSTFGDRLAGAREALGMSQADLSRKLGVKLKTIHAWEDDFTEPRSNKLLALSGVLNVSIIWLLTGKGDGIENPDGEGVLSTDVRDLLTEIRDVRGQITRTADRLSLLEKRLRATLKSEQ